jgi:hypothetical protein
MMRALRLIAVVFIISTAVFAQDKTSTVENIFRDIEAGISQGRVASIAKYFSPQTYFSFTNGVSGYYSANQAYYVLQDFFNIYQALSFKLNNIHSDETNPYATGVYNYELKGKRGTAQVYISLKNTGGSWRIIQITFN